ncbi:unnamed protein product [Choristocarpus tenellus]
MAVEIPNAGRLYEIDEDEGGTLQLQWMRVDMTNLKHQGWSDTNGCNKCCSDPCDRNVLPSVYGLNPLEEHQLLQIGKDLTFALSSDHCIGKKLPAKLLHAAAELGASDWSTCFDKFIDISRCEPELLMQLLASCDSIPPECLVESVLPSLLAHESLTQGERGGEGYNSRNTKLMELCNTVGRNACLKRADPKKFRELVTASGLREMGRLGKEAEICIAEAFFYAY